MSDLPTAAEMEEITARAAPEGPGIVLCECFARDGLQHEAGHPAARGEGRDDRPDRRLRLPPD
ncbi:hypothetical protein [Dankookia sp. P2]|uniref:hypothetical protein n=1 Tax=Dankookia sp. P2 TaxID=3423955 RepID=UPI003D669B77